ncbi:MAG: hypothetical protein RLZZ618_4076 [Pseudomonadota bacterium]|jgi:hypothetical protein
MTATTRCSNFLRTTVAVLALGAAASAAQAVEMRGFRGVAWGEASVKLGEATLVSQAGEVSCYQRNNENLLFGDSPVNNVRFCFKQDRLFLVSVESAQPADALAEEFTRTYGKPTRSSAGRSEWAAHRGQAQAEVMSQAPTGSALHVYSAGSQRKAVNQALALIAPAKAPVTIAYLAK